MEEFLQVGVISSTHGIAGEVKVFPTTDDVKRFKKTERGHFRHRKRTDDTSYLPGEIF